MLKQLNSYQTIIISKQFNSWFVGNILFGGIPGGVVDAITEAMWNLEPSIVTISLESVSVHGRQEVQVVFTSLDDDKKGNSLRIPL
jgi:hypothetical protein